MALRIRRGDLVQVVTGSDRGKQGRVLAVDRERGRLRVEKVRMQKRHLRPGRKALKTGGVLEQEGYIDASNVMLVDPESHRPARVRVASDGRVTVIINKAEMGQGVCTSLAMLLAEELDADWSQVGFEFAPVEPQKGAA